MSLRLVFSMICILLLGNLLAQKPPETEDEFEKAFKKRISRDMLNGVYIPKDLPDAFVQLNRLIDKESKEKFKKMPEEIAAKKLHFSFGRWIIYNWGFYGGSRLSKSINDMGVYGPDDMAQFVITAYHRSLNRKPLEIKALIEAFHERKEKEKAERLQNGEVIHQEKRKRVDDPN